MARRVVIDLTALVIAALLLHATLTASGASGILLTMAGKVTRPLTWPIARLPGVGGHLVVADIITIALALVACAIVAGVVAGYAAEASRREPARHDPA